MGKLVAVNTLGEITIHLPDASGNYATLCGMDDDDPHHTVDQMAVAVPKGAKVNCWNCRKIFDVCRGYTVKDFERPATKE